MTDEEKNGPPAERLYYPLVETVEKLYIEHGDTHRGMGFRTEEGFEARYRVYLEVIRGSAAREECSLLDVGCGTARLLDLIKSLGRDEISYRGVDLSPKLLEAARKKHPGADFILGDPFDLEEIWSARPDYVVFGGIFTSRLQMSVAEMTDYMLRMLSLAFTHCRRGVVFDVISAHVDWQRDDLFHVSFDQMADLMQANLNRNYVFRADYGRYEYAVYVYK
ncbi:MAG: class I SAM-dependent methyltransferase [Verrucomicrobiota bacterium]|nr:class I SAM-dependent methyltransferase [Verrucomicrobiota bacterium]